MTGYIRCFYTCDLCGTRRQHVEVPERDPVTHDVVQWLQGVATPALVHDHALRSPGCRPAHFAEIGIPTEPATEHVGTKVRS